MGGGGAAIDVTETWRVTIDAGLGEMAERDREACSRGVERDVAKSSVPNDLRTRLDSQGSLDMRFLQQRFAAVSAACHQTAALWGQCKHCLLPVASFHKHLEALQLRLKRVWACSIAGGELLNLMMTTAAWMM
eukprot:CAMPEP_0178375618 /NCGR_PEP_ID=MMETSP0689_2-20121128/2981_1 /TAXON_ID=160604 /ORGANISM="Amphidinium massartii, Strain CS-259" /LENGTH=132 /DNA_ID=CAMNT_0019995617 /DNA_START=187 /DNA_END=587 /DNA_ORIENTATION=-